MTKRRLQWLAMTVTLLFLGPFAGEAVFAQSTYTLSGIVYTPTGAPAGGVKISFKRMSGTSTTPKFVITAADGTWTRAGFGSGSGYKVTPSQKYCRFTPKPVVASGPGSALQYTRACLVFPDAQTIVGAIGIWESLTDAYIEIDVQRTRYLRFSNAVGNAGPGNLEIYAGKTNPDGTQLVRQRIYREDGTSMTRAVGTFIYHPTHAHIHFEDFAQYNLREVTADGGMGALVAPGNKVSFCLLDSAKLPGTTTARRYSHCDAKGQGISGGWADVYPATLPDQWIVITDVPDGTYWLESVADPDNHLQESDETNNSSAVKITIEDINVTVESSSSSESLNSASVASSPESHQWQVAPGLRAGRLTSATIRPAGTPGATESSPMAGGSGSARGETYYPGAFCDRLTPAKSPE